MFESYDAAKAEAQKRANASRLTVGVERMGARFNVFYLPRKANRSGHELQCEAVDPDTIKPGDRWNT